MSGPRPTRDNDGPLSWGRPDSEPPKPPRVDDFDTYDEFSRWVERDWAPFVDGFLAWVGVGDLVRDYRHELVGEHARDHRVLGAHPRWHFSPKLLPPWATESGILHDPAADTLVEVTRSDYADHRMSMWQRFGDDAGASLDAIDGAQHAIDAIRYGDYDTVRWSPAPGGHVDDYGVSEAGIYLTPWNADIWAWVAAFEDDVAEGLIPALMHALYERDVEIGIDTDVSVGITGRIGDELGVMADAIRTGLPAVLGLAAGDIEGFVDEATSGAGTVPDSPLYEAGDDSPSVLAQAVRAVIQWVRSWPPESRAAFAQWPREKRRQAMMSWLRWFGSQIQG